MVADMRIPFHRLFRSVQRILLLLLCTAVLAPAAAHAEKELPVISVGAILGLTGPVVSMNQDLRDGAILAAEDLQRLGKANLQLHFEDSRWQPAAAVSAYRSLQMKYKPQAILIAGSGTSLAVKPLTEKDQVVLFSLAAHPQILTNTRFSFRYANRIDRDVQVFATALAAGKPHRTALITTENDWGIEFERLLKDELTKRKIEQDSVLHLPDESDFRSHLLQIFKRKPELLAINSFGLSAAQIILQARQLGFKGPIYANNGLGLSPDALAVLKDKAIGPLHIQVYQDPPAEFTKHFAARFQRQPSLFALMAYNQCELLAEAVRQRNAPAKPAAIADYLRGLGRFAGSYQEIAIGSDGDIVVDTVVKVWEAAG